MQNSSIKLESVMRPALIIQNSQRAISHFAV